MTAPDPIRRKALSVIREGRLALLSVRSDPDTLVVTSAVALVTGSRGRYAVDYTGDNWTCTCARGLAGVRCGHILAAQLVTGHTEMSGVRAA